MQARVRILGEWGTFPRPSREKGRSRTTVNPTSSEDLLMEAPKRERTSRMSSQLYTSPAVALVKYSGSTRSATRTVLKPLQKTQQPNCQLRRPEEWLREKEEETHRLANSWSCDPKSLSPDLSTREGQLPRSSPAGEVEGRRERT